MEEVTDQLESDKLSSSLKNAELDNQIGAKNKDLATKNEELTTKEKEIDNSIKEIIEKQREELKTCQISKGFKDGNRRTEIELRKIESLLLEIRYLENEG